MMRHYMDIEKKGRQIASILMVWIISATFLVIVVPMNAPQVKGQITHLQSTMLEDNMAPYDIDMTPNVVVWDPTENHIISENYLVAPGYTLNIPPVDEVYFSGFYRIEVMGKFITNSDGDPWSKTTFYRDGIYVWDGIYFHPFSEGRIYDTLIKNSAYGVVFYKESKLMYPGVSQSTFQDCGNYGLRLDGALNYTNVDMTVFDERATPSAINLEVTNGFLNISNTNFWSHRPKWSSLHISNAKVIADHVYFRGYNVPGNCVYVEGDSNGTVFSNCIFTSGNATEENNYYVRCNGTSILLDTCSFKTSNYGARSVIATENAAGVPAHPIVRHPSQKDSPGMWDDSFDNSTLKATGSSRITLQWYMEVYVKDPDNNPINNAPVWVKDRNGNPAEPPSKITDASGWARGFIVTEFIQYSNIRDNFNSFNISSENNTKIGYSIPETMMNMSKEVIVTVPFNPIPNPPPIVSFIQILSGIQSGPISIQYRLEDLNPGDDGNLSIFVEFWDPSMGWVKCNAHVTSDPTSNLNSNTLYTFVWDSRVDFPDQYSTDVKIKITPFDKAGPGTFSETGNFTVDNKAPVLITGPVLTPFNTTAFINWTVDEPAGASVWYGLGFVLTDLTTGSTGSAVQSVQLTDLQPGRFYTYAIISTDPYGNQYMSSTYTFETEIHIKLYKGWNMISIPPYLEFMNPVDALASIAGQYDAVQVYDVTDANDPWKHYKVGKPYGNDLTLVTEMMGLWIHMKNDAVLKPGHMDPTLDMMFPGFTSVVLEPGWNFVGYPSVSNRLIDDALTGVTYDIVQTYDSITGKWLSYDGSSGSLTHMELGKGYWIHCPSSATWQVGYA